MSSVNRLITLLGLMLVAGVAEAQGVPVLQNPGAANQIVSQGTTTLGTPTNLSVNRFEQVRYADQFISSNSCGTCATCVDIGCAINAAIADLGSGGGVVEVPAGTWAYQSAIWIKATNIWVRCQGWATTLVYTPTVSNPYAVLIGNIAAGLAGTTGVTFTGAQAADRFSNCTLQSSTYVSGSTGIFIEGGMGWGVSIDRINFYGGSGFTTFIGVGDWGDVIATANDYIQHNVMELNPGGSANTEYGVVAYSRAHNLVISDNVINDRSTSDSSVCVSVANSSSVKILNNDIENCGSREIQVGTSELTCSGCAAPTQGTVIRDNYLEPQTSSTLDVEVGQYAVGTVIAGNYMQGGGTQTYMIQIENGSNGVVVRDNTQLGIASGGSVIHNLGSQSPTVEGNTQ